MVEAAQPRVSHAAPAVDNVQYLRAVAALIVVASHTLANLEKTAGPVGTHWLPGTFGVEIFFVISGFIITHTSLERFGERGALGTFVKQRLWRIVPLYWVYTSLYVLLVLLMPQILYNGFTSWPHIAGSYLFFPVQQPNGSTDPIYLAGWSLNHEMFFYALFAAVLWLPARAGLAVAAAVLGAMALLHPLFPDGSPMSVWSRPYVLEFLCGMGLAVLLRRAGRPGPHWALWPAWAALIACALAYFPGQPAGTSATPVLIALSALLVSAAVFCRDTPGGGPVHTVMMALGNASYSLYLVHMFAVRICIKGFDALGLTDRLPWPAVLAACVLLAVAMAMASYLMLEQGLFRRMRRAMEGRGRALKPLPEGRAP